MISCLVLSKRSLSLNPRAKACISYLILPLLLSCTDLSLIARGLRWRRRGSFRRFWRKRGKSTALLGWSFPRNCKGFGRSGLFASTLYSGSPISQKFHPLRIYTSPPRPRLGGLRSRNCPCAFWISRLAQIYVFVDEVGSDPSGLLLRYDPFLKPLDWLPTFEFDEYLIGVDVLEEVEEDAAVDRVTCDVEGFVDLDEDVRHNRLIQWYL